MALKLITDSATDLPKWVIDKYKLHVIPTPVVIEEKDYFDGETIFPEEFYQILRSGTDIKTYHVSQYMFETNFEPYAKAGDEVIYFCFSTGIAGTFQAASLAKGVLLETYPDFDLTIMDSKCASLGFGVCVYIALLMQEKGASKQEIIDAARFHFDHMEHIITVETLEYLYKGGRLSRTAMFAGSLLDIKPIIEITDEGALQAFEKIRGRNKSIKRVIELVGERGKDLNHQVIGIAHGDCLETAEAIRDELSERYGCKTFLINFVGCAIGAHTGAGIIGVVFLNEVSPYRAYFEV